MQLEPRIFCVERAQEVLVPLDVEIRMQAALHQHARSAKLDRLVNALLDLLHRMDVCIRFTRPPIERAEGADDVANVRIIDVTVDDVGYDVGVVLASAYLVGGKADPQDILRFEERRAIFGRKPFARKCFIENWLDCVIHDFDFTLRAKKDAKM